MITSMTGFGRGEASKGGIQVTVEIKTLNSRYLDISTRMPSSISDKELDVKEIIQEHLSRGKALVNINVDKTAAGIPNTTYNKELLKTYSEMMQEMRTLANISEPIQFNDLYRFDDIFESRKEDEKSLKIIWKCAQKAIKSALKHLNKMREKEGQELENDLKLQTKGIIELLDKVIEQSSKKTPETRDKLQKRILKLVDDEHFDPDRMEMEVAILVDKMDINEEVVRLKSHLKFFLEALNSDETVGRRLNFLSQEINRELNTIGSKANDSSISHNIVLAKEKLEQIREQVQNVE